MTFSLNAADPDVWRTELKQFWQQWVAQLNGAMPDMMLNSVDAGQRSQLFSFTRQMQGLHDYVVQLLEGILYRGEHAQPLLRGFISRLPSNAGKWTISLPNLPRCNITLRHRPSRPGRSRIRRRILPKRCLTRCYWPNPIWPERTVSGCKNEKANVHFLGVGALAALTLWGYWHYYHQLNYRAGEEVLTQAKPSYRSHRQKAMTVMAICNCRC